jgi:hypothetical protein
METFTPKYRRDGNAKVDSLYYGVAHGGGMLTSVVKRHPVEDRMEATRTREAGGLARGQSGKAAVIILGGMETTLDEMEYLLVRQKERMAQPFVRRKTGGEVAQMCQDLTQRRNDQIRHFQANPSEKPKKKPVRLHLPVGCHWAPTAVPGFKVMARI